MSLRAKLFLLLTAGAATFLLGTALIRGSIERRQGLLQAATAAELASEDARFEIKRRCDRLAVRMSSWHSLAEQRLRLRGQDGGAGIGTPWQELAASAGLQPGETFALVNAAGDVLAVEGALADDRGRLEALLGSRGLAGRAGFNGIRSGVVQGGDEPTIGVSVVVPEGLAAGSTSLGAVPGTALRTALLAPLDLASTVMRAPGAEVLLAELDSDELPARLANVTLDLWRSNGVTTITLDGGTEQVVAIEDAAGRAAFLLAASAYSPSAGSLIPGVVLEGLVWEALVAFMLIALAMVFVHSQVQHPMRQIQLRATKLARTEHGTLRFHSAETGEFGELATTLDSMLAKIQADRKEVVRSARIAGMSDVSMGVVHSAGNILNSVNVSTKVLARDIEAIAIGDMRRMTAELEEHRDDIARYVTEDPSGQFFIPFLAAMTEALDDLRTRCLVELESVEHGVAHVVDLIRSQEKYAIGASVLETASMEEVLDMAVNIAMLANERSGEVDVERFYADIPTMRVDRHKLTSILINIVANAIEALTDARATSRRLELSIYPMTDEMFVVEVTDSGVGIEPEHLDSIFNSSFSTKENSSGQGLHTTANLCKELGIAIGAVSEGIGCGTTVKLRVPFAPPAGDEGSADVESPGPALPAPPPHPGGAQPWSGQIGI